MSDWIAELTQSLAEEYADNPHVATLATIDRNGHPRARNVICRKIGPDGSLWIASDARSEKNEHLRGVPQSEVVFWLPKRREQYRVMGSVKIMTASPAEPARNEIWQAMSDASRALFFWPSPGAKRIDPPESFSKSVEATTPPPASFEVLVVRPRRVEQLQLSVSPHRRRRWMLAGNWSAGSEINP